MRSLCSERSTSCDTFRRPQPNRGRWPAWPDLGERWSAGLVATPSEHGPRVDYMTSVMRRRQPPRQRSQCSAQAYWSSPSRCPRARPILRQLLWWIVSLRGDSQELAPLRPGGFVCSMHFLGQKRGPGALRRPSCDSAPNRDPFRFSPTPLISCANLRSGGVLIGADRDPAPTVPSI